MHALWRILSIYFDTRVYVPPVVIQPFHVSADMGADIEAGCRRGMAIIEVFLSVLQTC